MRKLFVAALALLLAATPALAQSKYPATSIGFQLQGQTSSPMDAGSPGAWYDSTNAALKLHVPDGTDPFSFTADHALSFGDGSSAAVCTSSRGCLRWNNGATRFEQSPPGGPWAALGGSTNGLLGAYQGASSTAQNVLGMTTGLGPVVLQAPASAMGPLLQVQNNAATKNFLNVTDNAAVTITGAAAANGTNLIVGGINSTSSAGGRLLDLRDVNTTEFFINYNSPAVNLVSASGKSLTLYDNGGASSNLALNGSGTATLTGSTTATLTDGSDSFTLNGGNSTLTVSSTQVAIWNSNLLNTTINMAVGTGEKTGAPGALLIRGTQANGTNINGAGLNIGVGQGTGNASGNGNLAFQYSPAIASGSTQQTLANAVTINGSTGLMTALHSFTINGGTFTLPSGNAFDVTIANSWTGVQTFTVGALAVQNSGGTFSTTLATNATAARTWTLPDATDTAAGLGSAQTFTGANTFTATITDSQTTNTSNIVGLALVNPTAATAGQDQRSPAIKLQGFNWIGAASVNEDIRIYEKQLSSVAQLVIEQAGGGTMMSVEVVTAGVHFHGPLDMGTSWKINNLAAGTAGTDAVNLTQLNGAITGSTNTLAQVYANATGAAGVTLLMSSTQGPVILKDNATPIGTLFQLQTNGGANIALFDASHLTFGQADTVSTSAGALTVDSAAALNLGTSNATSIAMGKSGITTTVTGGFTQLTGAFSATGNAASSLTTSSGALTLTSAAAATWSTSAGALTESGFGGINLQINGTTVADVGVTTSTDVTMAAGKNFTAAAGASAFKWGSATGDSNFSTGQHNWAGASGKTASLVSTAAGITITADAASTWSTSTGVLSVSGKTGINFQVNGTTYADLGVTFTTGIFTNTITGVGTSSSLAQRATEIYNSTAAAAGAQQYSPLIGLGQGQGWKTNATAASQAVAWYGQTQPVQGAAAPTGEWHLYEAIAAGTPTDYFKFTDGGLIQQQSGLSLTLKGWSAADGASAIGLILSSVTSLANASSELVSFQNAGVEKLKMRGTDAALTWTTNATGLKSSGGNGVIFTDDVTGSKVGYSTTTLVVSASAITATSTGNVVLGGAVGWALHSVADAAYSMAAADTEVQESTLTATRIITLPAANTSAASTVRFVRITDMSGSASGTVKIQVQRSSTDTVNGVTTAVDCVTSANAHCTCTSDHSSKWACGLNN